jgi:exonuclease III
LPPVLKLQDDTIEFNCSDKNVNDYLKILSINAQSLADINHVTLLRHYLSNEIVDIAGISETWLKSKHDNVKMFEIDGYEMLRHDRPETRGGGVAFYIRKGIAFEIICKSKNGEHEGAEYLMICLKLRQVKLLLCIVYRRPQNDVTFTNLFADLNDHFPNHDQCVVMGDFNCNFKKDSVLLRSLNFEAEELGFER